MKKYLLLTFYFLISIFAYAEKKQMSDIISVLPSEVKENNIVFWIKDDKENFYYEFKKDDKYYICGPQKDIGPFEDKQNINFIPEYGLTYSIIENEKTYFLIGNTKLGPYDSVEWSPIFSKNKKHFFLIPKIGDDYFIVTDTQTFGPFKHEPSFTEIKNNGSVCYGVKNDLKTEIFIDSKKIDEAFDVSFFYGQVDSFFYTKDDAKPGTHSFYYNGKYFGPYEKIIFLYYQKKPLWLYQEKGKKTVIMNGDKKCYDLPFYISSSGYNIRTRRIGKKNFCVFSSDNHENKNIFLLCNEKLVSYSYVFEKDGKEFVSFNDKEYGPYDDVLFSGITGDSVFWQEDSWSIDETTDEDVFDGPAGIEGIPPFLDSWSHYGEKHDLTLYRNGNKFYEFNNCHDHYIDDLIENKKGDYVIDFDFHKLCVNGTVYEFGFDDFFLLDDFVNETSDFIAMTVFDSYFGYSLWKDNKFYKAILTDDSVYYIDGDVIRKIILK